MSSALARVFQNHDYRNLIFKFLTAHECCQLRVNSDMTMQVNHFLATIKRFEIWSLNDIGFWIQNSHHFSDSCVVALKQAPHHVLSLATVTELCQHLQEADYCLYEPMPKIKKLDTTNMLHYEDASSVDAEHHEYMDLYPTLEELIFDTHFFESKVQSELAVHPRAHVVKQFYAQNLKLGNMIPHLKKLTVQDVYDGKEFANFTSLRDLIVEYTPHEELRFVTTDLERLSTSCHGEIEDFTRFVNLKILSLYLNGHDLDPKAAYAFPKLELADIAVNMDHSLAVIIALPHVPTIEMHLQRFENPEIDASLVPKDMTFKNLELHDKRMNQDLDQIIVPHWLPFCKHLTSLKIFYNVVHDIDMNWKDFVNLKSLSLCRYESCTFFNGLENIPNLEHLHFETTDEIPESFIDGEHFPKLKTLSLFDAYGFDLYVTECKHLQTVTASTTAKKVNNKLTAQYGDQLVEFAKKRFYCKKLNQELIPTDINSIRMVKFKDRLEWHATLKHGKLVFRVNDNYKKGLQIYSVRFTQ